MKQDSYSPFSDTEFMSKRMLNYFRDKLLNKRKNLVARLADPAEAVADINYDKEEQSRVTQESEITLRASNRARLNSYLQSIDSALQRIEEGVYGYCAKTKCPISLRRLEIQPTALYSIEAQEEIEEQEEQAKLRAKIAQDAF